MAPFKNSTSSDGETNNATGTVEKQRKFETDPATIDRRQRQIDFGKVTKGYNNYLSAVPKNRRSRNQPATPDKHQVCSRRSFDGQIRIWRLLLHAYDDDDVNKNKSVGSGDTTSPEWNHRTDINGNREEKCQFETDPKTIAWREKEIYYGKITRAYRNYVTAIPKTERSRIHPTTPNKYQPCSRRSFEDKIKTWRREVGLYDDMLTAKFGNNDNVQDQARRFLRF